MENDERQPSDEEVVREEEEAAAAQAGRIGGEGGAGSVEDEAKRPLAESGEGEAEGFEQAEEELIEHAGGPDPADEAFTPRRIAATPSTASPTRSSRPRPRRTEVPHTVRKGKGRKPWKIVNKDTGEVKGASETKRKAQASARIRDQRAND